MTNKTIDMSEVVYEPSMVPEVRGSLNTVINIQIKLVNWMTKRIDSSTLSNEEREEYHKMLGEQIDALKKMTQVFEKEDDLCPSGKGMR